MAKIKVTVDPVVQSGDVTKDEVLALANTNTAPDVVPHADVIRDANGKVIEVQVNLPDNMDAPGLETARAAIEANNGVSKATSNRVTLSGGAQDFSTLDVDDTLFTIGNLVEASGDLEISDEYEAAGGPSRAMRYLRKAAQLSSGAYFNIVGDLFNVAYDSFRFKTKVFLESPIISDDPEYPGRLAVVYSTAEFQEGNALDPFDAFYGAGNRANAKIKMGKIEIDIENDVGAIGGFPPDPLDGTHRIKAKIGNSTVHEFTTLLPIAMHQWIEIDAQYDGVSGIGSVSITVDGVTEVKNWTGLSGLLISARSDQEFRLEKTATSLNITGGPFVGGPSYHTLYLDEFEAEILNVVGP